MNDKNGRWFNKIFMKREREISLRKLVENNVSIYKSADIPKKM